ncbi:hypothetical protein LIA77_05950 [Sarocladium implicatum]|nr:hypothetical protein LIA77_05950 [Sarocladium implicatum]
MLAHRLCMPRTNSPAGWLLAPLHPSPAPDVACSVRLSCLARTTIWAKGRRFGSSPRCPDIIQPWSCLGMDGLGCCGTCHDDSRGGCRAAILFQEFHDVKMLK